MSVAFAPSGNLVASGGLDNICTVYNVKAASPKTLRELDAHTGEQTRYKCFLWKFLQINKKLSSWYTNHTQGTYLAAVSLVILKFWQLLVTLLGEFSREKRVWMIFFFRVMPGLTQTWLSPPLCWPAVCGTWRLASRRLSSPTTLETVCHWRCLQTWILSFLAPAILWPSCGTWGKVPANRPSQDTPVTSTPSLWAAPHFVLHKT